MGYTLTLSEDELTRFRQMAAHARDREADAWRRAGAVDGARVADVGCGPGVISCELARIVGAAGRIHGVEREENTRATANALLAAEGVENVRIIDGDAKATCLEPGAYDLVMLRHVLVHNGGDEAAILEHLARLLDVGGHLYVVETDLTAVRRVPDDEDLLDMEQRWLGMLRDQGCDLAVGAKLQHLVRGAGLELVDAEARFDIYARSGNRPPEWAARDAMLRAGVATAEDVARWEAALARMDRDERQPLVYVPMYRAVGRRGG